LLKTDICFSIKWINQVKIQVNPLLKNMSDSSISIVPAKMLYPDAEKKATEITKWLQELKVIKAEQSYQCIPGVVKKGYAIEKGAAKVVQKPDRLPFENGINGLEISISRRVFHAGEDGLKGVFCPHCEKNVLDEDWDLNPWIKRGHTEMACPFCKRKNELSAFIIKPLWAFSNLGFTFWNWPGFTPAFLKTFESKLECEMKIVNCQL
jgi:hypothetical protein